MDFIYVWDVVTFDCHKIPLIDMGLAIIVSLDVLKRVFGQSATGLELKKNNKWEKLV